MKRILFLSLMFLIIHIPLYADWGPYSIENKETGIMIPVEVENNTIKMEEAVIVIKVNEFDYDISYDCSFKFKNLTKKHQDATIGFPVQYSKIWDIRTRELLETKNIIQHFYVEVNGESTALATPTTQIKRSRK
ncbi:MAG: hypothetical protein JXB88_27225 [Spirochaetales bacterium]|nr:hypothetical protein [Spirochaetales bacterium]